MLKFSQFPKYYFRIEVHIWRALNKLLFFSNETWSFWVFLMNSGHLKIPRICITLKFYQVLSSHILFFLSSAANYCKTVTSSHTFRILCSAPHRLPRPFDHLSAVSCVSTEHRSAAQPVRRRPAAFFPASSGRQGTEHKPGCLLQTPIEV